MYVTIDIKDFPLCLACFCLWASACSISLLAFLLSAGVYSTYLPAPDSTKPPLTGTALHPPILPKKHLIMVCAPIGLGIKILSISTRRLFRWGLSDRRTCGMGSNWWKGLCAGALKKVSGWGGSRLGSQRAVFCWSQERGLFVRRLRGENRYGRKREEHVPEVG